METKEKKKIVMKNRLKKNTTNKLTHVGEDEDDKMMMMIIKIIHLVEAPARRYVTLSCCDADCQRSTPPIRPLMPVRCLFVSGLCLCIAH